MELEINDRLQLEIDILCKRLKNSINHAEVIRWLKNFKAEEIEYALDILFLTEYITANEIFECYRNIFTEIFNCVDKDSIIIVHPIGEFGKSGTAMFYYAKKALKDFEQSFKIDYYQHYRQFKVMSKKNTNVKKLVVIFIDDIYGTGDSAIKYFDAYIKHSLSIQKETPTLFFISVAAMNEAKVKIESNILNARVLSGMFRDKVFSDKSLLFESTDRMKNVRQICYDYGKVLYLVDGEEKPLGYNNSQALIVFSYGAPNNTLPIIWSTLKGWYAIFPRFLEPKISQSREARREVAFLLGVAKFFNILDFITIEEDENNKIVKYIKKHDFQLLAFLKLKYEKNDVPTICQKLGLFEFDYDRIVKEAIKRNFIDDNCSLTIQGITAFSKIIKLIEKLNLRRFESNKAIFREVEYLPITFRGKL